MKVSELKEVLGNYDAEVEVSGSLRISGKTIPLALSKCDTGHDDTEDAPANPQSYEQDLSSLDAHMKRNREMRRDKPEKSSKAFQDTFDFIHGNQKFEFEVAKDSPSSPDSSE